MSEPTNGLGFLYLALSKAQGEFKELKRDRTVKVKTKDGGSYEYSYATLAAIRDAVQPALTKYELAISQLIILDDDGESYLVTTLGHSSGQKIYSKLWINTEQAPQALGSALTYFRRYSLSALLGVVADEDDDGTAAQNSYTPSQRAPRPSTAASPIKPAQSGGVNPPQASKITAAQLTRLHTIKHASNWRDEDLKAVLKKKFDYESSSQLTLEQYDQICELMQKHPRPKDDADVSEPGADIDEDPSSFNNTPGSRVP